MAGVDNDSGSIIELLLGHKTQFTRQLLKANGLPISGTREELTERLTSALQNGEIKPAELIAHLDRIEGWGNQHIYLYRSPQPLLTTWRNETKVLQVLKANGHLNLFKKPRPIALPKKPTLSTIEWDRTRARFVWIVKRSWEDRVEDKDHESGSTIWKAYQRRTARGVLAFDWDLGTGVAMIMIQRLPSGSNYEAVRDDIIQTLKPMIDVETFELIRVSRSILRIARGTEVDVRGHVDQTKKGGKVHLVSPGRNSPLKDDPELVKIQATLGGNAVGYRGNFYWHPTEDGRIETRLHTTVHAKDQRIGIFGDRIEQEVRHVIARIRSYC